MRQRPAPNASRKLISRCRTADFASSRFATLAQAINSTKPASESSASSGRS